jgi:hypothetical protein
MKSRILWAAVVLVAVVAFYFATIRPAMRETTPQVNRRQLDRAFKDFKPPEIPPPPLPEVVIATPKISPPPPRSIAIVAPRNDPVPGPLEVPIQDGKTIDFSTGAPVIRMQGKDQEALERGLREMAEATKDITFPPTKKQ